VISGGSVGGGGKRDGGREGRHISLSLCTDTDDRVTLGEDPASHAFLRRYNRRQSWSRIEPPDQG